MCCPIFSCEATQETAHVRGCVGALGPVSYSMNTLICTCLQKCLNTFLPECLQSCLHTHLHTCLHTRLHTWLR